jgi:hypothetical protein
MFIISALTDDGLEHQPRHGSAAWKFEICGDFGMADAAE